ncbi:SDR family oxidoreductase, partial [Parabacteroides goldsteinii]
SKFASLTETSVEDFDQTLSANLRPAFITSRLLAIHRQSQTTPNSYGRIINISSTHYPTNRLSCEAYAASRSGICSLTQTLAMSLSPCHTTVNSIIPGWIQADDYDQIDPEAHPIPFSGRMGKPEDITRICLFLCQEENDFINGENITIDGGTTRTPMTIIEKQQL